MSDAGPTRALARGVQGLRYEDVPDDAREAARHCLLDFLGCAVAGSREPLSEILAHEIAAHESGTATLLGRPQLTAPRAAALANGAAGHALDFDDTHTVMSGHPTVPVAPAVLALAEARGADGRAVLTALVAGIELECRVTALLGPGHYAAGFHATGTVGAFGAAAACAHLLGLGEEGWLAALGLAGTQAAGLKSAFGSMAKPLHAGCAAAAGLLSAQLARGGFTASPAVLEAPQGFAATHAGKTPSADDLAPYAGRFLVRDTLFKVHAACYLTHAAIEAAGRLREDHAIDPGKVESVEVEVAPPVLDVCNIEAPATGLEGKFSLRATAAMALRGDDTSDLASYSDGHMADPALVALRDRVRVTTREGVSPTWSRVRVRWAEGEAEAEADTGVPAMDLEVQRERLLAKFHALAGPVLGGAGAARLAEAALEVDERGSAAELLDLARPPT